MSDAMPNELRRLGDTTVLVCDADGDPIREESDALDLIGDAYGREATWVAVPVHRLADDFFRLRTGVAGELTQKFVNYRIGFAVVGDISSLLDESATLQDFVREANEGAQLWFVPSLEILRERLGG